MARNQKKYDLDHACGGHHREAPLSWAELAEKTGATSIEAMFNPAVANLETADEVVYLVTQADAIIIEQQNPWLPKIEDFNCEDPKHLQKELNKSTKEKVKDDMFHDEFGLPVI